MAAKKTNVVEEPKVEVTEEVIEDAVVEEVTEEVTDEAQAEDDTPEEEPKKVGPIKRWAHNKVEKFKAHPVKETAKTLGEGVVLVLSVVGAKTVIETIIDNPEVVDAETVELLTDKLTDTAEDIAE